MLVGGGLSGLSGLGGGLGGRLLYGADIVVDRDLGLEIAVVALVGDGSGSGEAEDDQDDSQPPGAFLHKIGSFADTHDLVRGREIGGEATTLRVLDKDHDGQKYTDNNN